MQYVCCFAGAHTLGPLLANIVDVITRKVRECVTGAAMEALKL